MSHSFQLIITFTDSESVIKRIREDLSAAGHNDRSILRRSVREYCPHLKIEPTMEVTDIVSEEPAPRESNRPESTVRDALGLLNATNTALWEEYELLDHVVRIHKAIMENMKKARESLGELLLENTALGRITPDPAPSKGVEFTMCVSRDQFDQLLKDGKILAEALDARDSS